MQILIGLVLAGIDGQAERYNEKGERNGQRSWGTGDAMVGAFM